MIFIYDILSNFNKELFPFYDWNKNDTIIHIKKIPLIKINPKVYNLILSSSIKLDPETLKIILNKTEVFNNKKQEIIKYCAIFTNEKDSIVAIFNNDGTIDEVSKMIVEEELETLELSLSIKEVSLQYEEIKKDFKNTFLTRHEAKKIKIIINEIDKLKQNNQEQKIKYLYFEWFNKQVKTSNYFEELKQNISLNYTEKHQKFEQILNLISLKK